MVNNIKFAELFGFMLGDGWLSLHDNGKGSICYNCGFSGDEESLNNVINDLKSLFGDDIGTARIRVYKTSSDKYSINGTTTEISLNTRIAKIFLKYGMPIGKRVEQDYSIPDWIINGTQEIKAAFISGIYAAEGYTPKMQSNNKNPKVLGFNMSKRKSIGCKNLVNQFSKILDDLGIEYNVKIENVYTKDWNEKFRFEFCNNTENIFYVSSILPLNYCIDKHNKMILFNEYMKYKLSILNNPLSKTYNPNIRTKKRCSNIKTFDEYVVDLKLR